MWHPQREPTKFYLTQIELEEMVPWFPQLFLPHRGELLFMLRGDLASCCFSAQSDMNPHVSPAAPDGQVLLGRMSLSICG